MKILHLFSDWKWTGPAEPALNLCVELKKRGHDVTLACGKAMDDYPFPPDSESVEKYAYERGLVPVTRFHLSKHFNLFKYISDIKNLSVFMNDEAFDIVHVHRNQDHLVGGIAARRTGRRLPIVRTNHDGVVLKKNLRNKYCLTRLTDKLIDVSEDARVADMNSFGLSADKTIMINASIDCQRFNPGSGPLTYRKKFGMKDDDIVVGIIARIQTHRRFHILLKAIKIASKKVPKLKLLVIGRGTKEKQLLTEPAKEMGLEDVVVHPGYRTSDYVEAVSCMDYNIFLMPGTDGSSRAVREVMAMGKPVIAADRGMLSSIVDNNSTGFVIDDTPENLAEATVRLATDIELRKKMAAASLKKTQDIFSQESMAEKVENVYKELLLK
ncbi:glycosyl transferase, group 1 [Candidatus Scalindua japonica]|uniref:Glycosyl transferase, group 1 n=1 Tax=Candidatus Scalindua japonica TaxID=1284222 RepID=A0A286TWL9_9BACT|nr:glycosyltransferase family 4 protein [Candidatus Scalindua japonica]GAX60279.1 glycosyl transferase, group 1 [Candidatus Scalindua japonica]